MTPRRASGAPQGIRTAQPSALRFSQCLPSNHHEGGWLQLRSQKETWGLEEPGRCLVTPPDTGQNRSLGCRSPTHHGCPEMTLYPVWICQGGGQAGLCPCPLSSTKGSSSPFFPKSKLGKQKNLAVSHWGRGRVESKRPHVTFIPPEIEVKAQLSQPGASQTRGGQAPSRRCWQAAFAGASG